MKKIALIAIMTLITGNVSVMAQKLNKKEMKKVLFVVTSNDKLGNTGEKTGFWSEEFAAPYYELLDKGIEITIASPLGGQPPIDPKSADPASATEDTKRFDADTTLQEKLKNTHKLSTIDQKDYDAVFYPGGHGPLWDLVEDKNSIALIESFYNHKKPVAFVCHAPAVLKNVKVNGEFLVKGKKVTGFTNEEEEAVGLTKVVPFLLEDALTQNGAKFSKIGNWQPYAVEDGLLITGQNPASSKLVAGKLLEKLNK
ncbi:type 1 glutamine amidotransferase domain-containing protein [Flavobacterium sp. Fl-77]|uniref:Type 1 glutamine amidotransferase domain-containing protein n=1 Tax=Flavobacterium flavipigmentatum TaxID=2893884 RepID=A0AAJ2SAT5_9FLAO|nr:MULTISPECIES: type 1 glutamine amidotransferase domain-containing protein [unclassified Flavobacterium]MDX6180772.1 type 1 glutamine amidotransferase domain-containing protein [Flavobacterium sp. Fl-33]MDX6184372.1 type 1 glutamine amidotransferase domain-containing protein [Flavobacterium sp. Fl-77]UFH39481.1 type 1 glutamine amidotransferase domain-containing protein [Flavobacterium sp. F-70]